MSAEVLFNPYVVKAGMWVNYGMYDGSIDDRPHQVVKNTPKYLWVRSYYNYGNSVHKVAKKIMTRPIIVSNETEMPESLVESLWDSHNREIVRMFRSNLRKAAIEFRKPIEKVLRQRVLDERFVRVGLPAGHCKLSGVNGWIGFYKCDGKRWVLYEDSDYAELE